MENLKIVLRTLDARRSIFQLGVQPSLRTAGEAPGLGRLSLPVTKTSVTLMPTEEETEMEQLRITWCRHLVLFLAERVVLSKSP